MRITFFGLAALGLLVACSNEAGLGPAQSAAVATTTVEMASMALGANGVPQAHRRLPARAPASFAALPDRGELLHYDKSRAPVRRSAYTWHAVQLSEAHALRAVVGEDLVVVAPDGRPIRLRYERHVEHADGNWTWIGREPGAPEGDEAILTFGAKAVFGSIPNGDEAPLRLETTAGRAWLMETDSRAVAQLDTAAARPRKPDSLLPPALGADRPATLGAPTAAPQAASATAVAAGTVVDLAIGYTSAFATRLGGTSQAGTRLTFLVDLANQANRNSEIAATVRLVRTVQVSYPDTTSNEDALYALTGVECTELPNGSLDCNYVAPPASLQPLHAARDQYGADLVALVRNFNDPENGSCGLAWINGGGQVPITLSDEVTGFSVIADSNGNGGGSFPDNGYVCRNESLAHELGHNMGSAHDRDTSDGADNVLQQNEYGRYPYSFGYKTAVGNFSTIMAYGDAGQTGYRVFSNPAITYCGGRACGVANQADNARSLRQTMPIVATFRASVVPVATGAKLDFNGDGSSDVLWRHASNGRNSIWLSASLDTVQAVTQVSSLAWRMVGVGDVDADGKADIVWRNTSSGVNTIWRSGNGATTRPMASMTSAWQVVGMGDFDGDGSSDVLWRNASTGANMIWKSANQSTTQAMTTITDLDWKVAGVGDLNGDGRDDVLWRNHRTGGNGIWWSGNFATKASLMAVALAWQVAGVGDFNGDGVDDVLWRNASSGANSIWKSGNVATVQAVTRVANLAWRIEGTGDYDGNGADDVLWRSSTGANIVWPSSS